MLPHLVRLFAHIRWADGILSDALARTPTPPAECIREYAHILGADETWLSRLTQRPPRVPVWPALALPELTSLAADVHAGFDRYLADIDERSLASDVAYVNSAGQSFRTPAGEILLHITLHAQYHRGKINLLLRQAGLQPAPTDYIAFVRGVEAAVTPPSGAR
ncbi:MAG: hypothetical protein HOP28_13745 [Gemmatimonadales bacterium]|nr:hypothetical protein [Gemmatimonadales bacterium]